MNDQIDFENLKILLEKENLNEIFSTELNLFESIYKPKVVGNIRLWDLLRKIQYNVLDDYNFNMILIEKYINGKMNAEFERIKNNSLCVCYNATFNGYKNIDNMIAPTNLMFLDIDGFHTKEEALAYKSQVIMKYDWIVSCNLSLSRLGLHLLILVDSIYGNADFNMKYDYINKQYFDDRLDSNSKSITRNSIVPFDYNIYINENPSILEVDNVIRAYEKSICSEHKEEEIICTPYTFSPNHNALENTINNASRKNHLIFRTRIDESMFADPNKPLYWADGIDYMEVNLYPYKKQKVRVGNRNKTIGAIGIQMLYLNAKSVSKREIENFMVNINRKICSPPLADQEVRNSFYANWKVYENGKLNFNSFIKKKYVFWSPRCKLSANEKRKISCSLRKEPTREKTRDLINDTINGIYGKGEKVTQKKIARTSGLSVQTVKNYWHEYKSKVRDINVELKLEDSIKYDSYR